MKYIISIFMILAMLVPATAGTKFYKRIDDWYLFKSTTNGSCGAVGSFRIGTNIAIAMRDGEYKFSINNKNVITNSTYEVHAYTDSGKYFLLNGLAVDSKQIIFTVSKDFIESLAKDQYLSLGQFGITKLSNTMKVVDELKYCSSSY